MHGAYRAQSSLGLQRLTEQPSLQERAYRALREALLRQDYKPSERLIEVEVAERLGISRSPVREAIRRLQQDGLVEIRPREGVFVSSVSKSEIEDVYAVRRALEGTAAALAAQRISEQELDTLEQILNEPAGTPDDRAGPGAVVLAERFHQAVFDAARSPRLNRMLQQVYGQVTHFRNVTLRIPDRASKAHSGHEEIYLALRSRNCELAEETMRRHVDGARLALIRHLQKSQSLDEGAGKGD